MNNNAKNWIKALRSGEYEQGQRYLKQGDKYCCLGVACDLYGKEHGIKWDESGTASLFMSKTSLLPDRVVLWLGLTHPSGDSVTGKTDLLTLNDARGSTFNEIADFLEANKDVFHEDV